MNENITASKDIIEGMHDHEPILSVKNLAIHYPVYGGILKHKIGDVKAVRDVTFDLYPDETVGIVGESGCGKTTIAKGLLNLVPVTSGEIYFRGERIDNHMTIENRKKIQMVFQSPDASLNPRMKIVDIVGEPLRNLMGFRKRDMIRRRVMELLELVSLKAEHLDRYPHEFSGGQKQRIIIARALACEPEVIVLDEPTSALDVSVQAQILNLLRDLQKRFHLAFIFITHDLSVIHHIGHRIMVMYLGLFVETGTTMDTFYNTQHPYTRALLSGRPSVNKEMKLTKIILEGEIPSPQNPPVGCSFNPRCQENPIDICREEIPPLNAISENHRVACWKREDLWNI